MSSETTKRTLRNHCSKNNPKELTSLKECTIIEGELKKCIPN